MKFRTLAVTAILLVLGLPSRGAIADGWQFDAERLETSQDLGACAPPVSEDIAARLYSYQLPMLILNELSPTESVWAYADACVKAPDGWVPGQSIDRGLREGKTWASLGIYQDPPIDAWQASFPPDETVRNMYRADDLSPLGQSNIYIPAFGPFEGLNPPVSLTDAPLLVPLGVPHYVAATLQEAGMITENGRVWMEYSAVPAVREGRNLKPYKAMRRWVHAYNLLSVMQRPVKSARAAIPIWPGS